MRQQRLPASLQELFVCVASPRTGRMTRSLRFHPLNPDSCDIDGIFIKHEQVRPLMARSFRLSPSRADVIDIRYILLLTLGIGILLNASVFWQRAQHLAVGAWFAEVMLVLSICLVIFSLMSATGRQAFRLLGITTLMISAAASYYMTFFHVVIGFGIIQAVTTDVSLSMELVNHQFLIWMFLFGCLPSMALWRATRLPRDDTHEKRSRLYGFLLRAVLLLLALVALQMTLQYFKHLREETARITVNQMPNPFAVAAHSYVPSNWIAGLGMVISSRITTAIRARQLIDPATAFQWTAPQTLDGSVVVLVIGETTRWDHMGILGYHRNTTPELEKQANTVAMKGTSCNTVTKLSLQCMFVRPGSLVEGDGDEPSLEREDNVFAVFKKLGFTIDLFAMQSEVGFYNRTHADYYKFREVIASEPYNAGKPVDDALLIHEMSDAIQRRAAENPKVRHLIILHTKGSHHSYSQRYPRSFARYTPECKKSDAFCDKASIINAFDNSVLYVDTVLSALMDRLKTRPAMIFYTADHGESIDENRRFHGTPKFMAPPEQFAVPIIAWASDAWLQQPARRALFRNLQQHHQQTAQHQELFDSLLGCLGIESPDGGIDASRNWCSPASLDKPAISVSP